MIHCLFKITLLVNICDDPVENHWPDEMKNCMREGVLE